jgi:hypothetical protein
MVAAFWVEIKPTGCCVLGIGLNAGNPGEYREKLDTPNDVKIRKRSQAMEIWETHPDSIHMASDHPHVRTK